MTKATIMSYLLLGLLLWGVAIPRAYPYTEYGRFALLILSVIGWGISGYVAAATGRAIYGIGLALLFLVPFIIALLFR